MGEQPVGFHQGQAVWVQDADGKHHSGVFVGDNEAAGWFRITPRDE